MSDSIINDLQHHPLFDRLPYYCRRKRIIQRWIQSATETIGTHDMSFHCLECGETMIGCKPSQGSNRPMPCCPVCSARMEVTTDDVLRGMIDSTVISHNAK
jgi:transcription elongation factor Elf1